VLRKDGKRRVCESRIKAVTAPRISAFPKCYLEEISRGSMTVFEWIERARQLDADGLEMYQGFFVSLARPYIEEVAAAIREAGFAMPMLCCSPDFTAPDAGERKRQIAREIEMIAVARQLGGPGTVCRVLSGQRYPEVSWEQGRAWVIEGIRAVLPAAHEYEVVLGFENHYKDGFWQYPEFAQKAERFLSLLNGIEDKRLGVQYDPSNAIVAEEDPIDLLRRCADRVVSMHASDRYWGRDGTLRHGVTGKGLNDYDAIFAILAQARYAGWISIEDGMNGMDEMSESLAYLRRAVSKYFPAGLNETPRTID
jgi:sugar phosphate isomerase/epimerase